MVVGNLKAILDIIDRLAEKRKLNAEVRNRDRVLVAIYTLGDNGQQSVGVGALLAAGFRKGDISSAIEMAEDRGWLIDAGHMQELNAWLLSRRGRLHVEGLLERGEREE